MKRSFISNLDVYYIFKEYIFSSYFTTIFWMIGLILAITYNYIQTNILIDISNLPEPPTDINAVKLKFLDMITREIICCFAFSLQIYAGYYVSSFVRQSSEKDLLKFFISLKYYEFKKIDVGEKNSKIKSYSLACYSAIYFITHNLIVNLFRIGFALFALIHKGDTILNIILIIDIVFSFILLLIFSYKISKISKKLYFIEYTKSSNIINILNNYEFILFKHLNEYEYMNLNKIYKKYFRFSLISENYYTSLRLLTEFLSKIYLFSSLFFGIYNKSATSMITVGSFIIIYGQIKVTLNNFPNDLVLIQANLVIIRDILYYKEDILNRMKKEHMNKIYEFARNITFKNILIKYGRTTILFNMDFQIEKGDKIAIWGKNGSGKSSLLKVILRFIEYSGNVLLDDIDIQNIEYESYLKLFSYIPQNVNLFNETIMYNIKYGNFFVEDEEIIKICKYLKIHESILILENGYKTIVGENGDNMSGGLKQKILLLRTIIKSADIYLFDEPTTSLGKNIENIMLQYIFNNLKNKTILMIIHDKKYLELFDKILIIKDKRIYKCNKNQDPEKF